MTIQTLEPHLIDSLRQSAREILETMVFLTPTGALRRGKVIDVYLAPL